MHGSQKLVGNLPTLSDTQVSELSRQTAEAQGLPPVELRGWIGYVRSTTTRHPCSPRGTPHLLVGGW